MELRGRVASEMVIPKHQLTSQLLDSDDEPDTKNYSSCGQDGRIVGGTVGEILVESKLNRKVAFSLRMKDVFTTVVDSPWWWVLAVYVCIYLFMWFFFAWIYYVLRTDTYQEKQCITGIETFWDAYFFSFQTQQTIGYGNFAPESHGGCFMEIIVVAFQTLVGLLTDSVVVGLVVSKVQRPQNRTSTILFSKSLVITLRENRMFLAFRVADMRRHMLCESHITCFLYCHHRTLEGELADVEAFPLEITPHKYTPLFLPHTFLHEITPDSPLATVAFPLKGSHRTPNASADRSAEIVVLLEGVSATTGMGVQARRSYFLRDALWGRDFVPLVSYTDGTIKVDYTKIDSTYMQEWK
eukprot:c9182_g1_i2.p1 GENE.c9182_g1_i2~~c9182_g1_i2.p1  ORF type:complete len:354 (-),score=84.02 c9182_g1_i2:314-1375(-)